MDLSEARSGSSARHPWEEARARFFLRVLGDAGIPGRGGTVLDVGAGDGWFARELAARFPEAGGVACWDTGYGDEVLERPELAHSSRVRFSRERPAGRFDLLLLLDVLEHVEDDAGFLASLVGESLAPGGWALVSVPAWPALFGMHDVRLRHHRRYRPSAARSLVAGAGLELTLGGGLFASLLPAAALHAARERLASNPAPPRDAAGWSAPAAVTAVVRWALSCDARASLAAARLGISMPGLSYWALCRRP